MNDGRALRAEPLHMSEQQLDHWSRGRVDETDLANALQNADGVLEVADMEDRDDKFNVCIVSHTVHRVQSASLAEGAFLCRSLALIQMRVHGLRMKGTYQTTIEHTILDGQAVDGGV